LLTGLVDSESDVQAADGEKYVLTPDFIKIERKVFKEASREFTPNVIEPSFGIGRILYSLLEHSYWAREKDADRRVLSLPPAVAPIKCLIVPLSGNEGFRPLLRDVCEWTRSLLSHGRRADDSCRTGHSQEDALSRHLMPS
jgi:glycyl-tRNA synthetase